MNRRHVRCGVSEGAPRASCAVGIRFTRGNARRTDTRRFPANSQTPCGQRIEGAGMESGFSSAPWIPVSASELETNRFASFVGDPEAASWNSRRTALLGAYRSGQASERSEAIAHQEWARRGRMERPPNGRSLREAMTAARAERVFRVRRLSCPEGTVSTRDGAVFRGERGTTSSNSSRVTRDECVRSLDPGNH